MAETDFLKEITKLEGGEFPLITLEINHNDLDEPIRVVNDNEDLTSNGDLYQAFNFRMSILSKPDAGAPTASLSFDNVGNIATDWISLSNGARGSTATFGMVLRSNPDVYEVPQITTNISGITITKDEISATLSLKDIVNQRANPIQYNIQTALGLF